MNATAKIGLIAAGGLCLLCVIGKSVGGDSKHAAYVEQLNKRPYKERDLAREYGIKPYAQRAARRNGPLAAMSRGSDASKVNNYWRLRLRAFRLSLKEGSAA